MKTTRFKFILDGKKNEMEVLVCDNIFSHGRGLMFRNDKKPLLFIFKSKKKRAIHSFFCKPFRAIWIDGDKIIDDKIIKKWRGSIKPLKEFDKLLEIPL